jgi:hypothetical protein
MSAEKSTSQNAPESTIVDTGMGEVPLKTWSETKAESFSTELADCRPAQPRADLQQSLQTEHPP